MLKKIWPWSTIAYLENENARVKELGLTYMHQRDDARARCIQLEERVKELKGMNEIDAPTKLSEHTPEQQQIKMLQSHVKALQAQVDDYKKQATSDVRTGLIMSDKQQATDIKFRSVKVDLQCMKKINKQASLALRYVAQKVQSNAIQSDLRAIAQIIHPDTFNEMGIEKMTTADMVEDTIAMGDLVRFADGKKEA